MFYQIKTGGGTEDKLKGKTTHEQYRLAEIEQVKEADNIS